ncbi:MAG: phosphatase PAP2 family protein [Chloroflexota bacterium]
MDVSIAASFYQAATSQAWLAGCVVIVAQAGVFALPLALVAVWFRSGTRGERHREAIVAGCVAAMLAVAIGLVLERALHRPRPFLELGFAPLFPHADDSSFPSDHTLVGVALVGALVWRARGPGLVLAAWAVVVGFARVAAGVHYPSDILGSAALAFVLDGLVWYTLPRRWLVRFSRLRSDAPPPRNPP